MSGHMSNGNTTPITSDGKILDADTEFDEAAAEQPEQPDPAA